MPEDNVKVTQKTTYEAKDKGILGNPDLFGVKTQSVPVPEKNVGIDYDHQFYENILNAVEVGKVDLAKIDSFTQLSQNRNLLYNVIDIMCEDSAISSILEVYAEDVTETNEEGHIIWAESEDANVSKYVNFLLDQMNVDKNVYQWVYSLCKYGDVYLRLYRRSDYEKELFNISDDEDENSDNEQEAEVNKRNFLTEQLEEADKQEAEILNEDVVFKAYPRDDKYAHYVEMVANPADMFEIIKLGKTFAYIKAPTTATITKNNQNNVLYSSAYVYAFKKKDVVVFEGTEFVHGCLLDNVSRVPEEVEIFMDDDETSTNVNSFTVKRGQSLLYNTFKAWRNLTLLENSLLLNRLSKSSIVRVVNVEVGDMPKEQIGPHLLGIKQLIEQKTAINENDSLQEYTNPGPVENNIYVPTNNGKGAITTQELGGNPDIKSIIDVDYFRNKMYSSVRIPKQYLGDTDDNTGFNGGTSLSLISSRYAKSVKRIQNVIIQMMNDVINLMLLDKGLKSYINKFELHMVTPLTQEEVDRRENIDAKIGVVNNIMALLDGIDDASQRLRILKALLADIITNQEVMDVLQEEVDKLLEAEEAGIDTTETNDEFQPNMGNFHPAGGSSRPDINIDNGPEDRDEGPSMPETNDEGGEEVVGELPTPDSLGMDFTDANMEI